MISHYRLIEANIWSSSTLYSRITISIQTKWAQRKRTTISWVDSPRSTILHINIRFSWRVGIFCDLDVYKVNQKPSPIISRLKEFWVIFLQYGYTSACVIDKLWFFHCFIVFSKLWGILSWSYNDLFFCSWFLEFVPRSRSWYHDFFVI